MRLLLVEDNHLQMKLIKDFLKETDFEVHTAQNAFEAWQLANTVIPDIALLDIMMPGMSGIDLCKKFKSNPKLQDIPIIFLTALGNKDDIIAGLKAGAADYIPKPFDQQELIARINVHLELKKSKDTIVNQNKQLVLELEKRRIAEENFRLFFHAVNSAPATVVITDNDGRIEYVNPAFTRITGYSLSEVQGKTPSILKSGYHSKESYKEIWDTVKSGKQWQGEFCNKKKDNTLFWEFASIAALKNDEDEFSHIVAVKVDISERKKYIEKINEYIDELKEINATKDKFFSIIAHDLKNPLSILMNSTEILASPDYKLSDDEITDFSQEIHKSSRRLYNLLENLLTWARSQTGRLTFQPDYCVISDIVNASMSYNYNTAQSKNIKITSSISDNTIAYCDYNMVATIFRNLVSNAVKFTPSNGTIEINLDKTLTSPKNGNKYVQFSVTDSGVGIRQEDIPKLFRIDVSHSTLGTAQEKGTGLGLILCKEFIKKHNGDIWVESTLGKGTKFSFTVPLTQSIEK